MKELRDKELEKVAELEGLIDDYRRSNLIREFISKMQDKFEPDYIEWALEHADHIDPTNSFRIEVLDN